MGIRILFPLRVWHLDDVSSGNLPLVHHIVYLWQLLQLHCLEWGVNQATSKEVEGLLGVLSVTDV